MTKRWLALLASVFYVGGAVYASLLLLKPPPPAALPKATVTHARLAEHLLFVVVDGLRYDVATDPERMPRFAKAMLDNRSHIILAGPVSMTSAAVQDYGSGQRGRVEQIARNINPDPPPFETWLHNAADSGLKLGLVGDPIWLSMYGSVFTHVRLDPPGAAIDYDFNAHTLRDAREILAKAPDALVLHFVTPDHQAHAYGVQSARYRAHIRHFDSLLFQLLSEVGPAWTVIVTSDHGANDAGDHGGDVAVQRRSPIFAYGPGISAPDAARETPLDQTDVAGTLAALLGVPAPAHSQGHVLVDWLAISEPERARMACNDVERSLAYTRTLDADAAAELSGELSRTCRRATAEPAAVVGEVGALARRVDGVLTSQQGVFSTRASMFVIAIALGAVALARLLLGPLPWQAAFGSAVAAAISIALVASVEKLPGRWPTHVTIALFVVLNLPLLYLLLRPEGFLGQLERYRKWAPALVPGALAVAYPRNLLPIAFAVTVVVAVVVLASPRADRWGIAGFVEQGRGRARELALLAIWALALLPAGTQPDGLAGMGLTQHAHWILGAALFGFALVVVELARAAPRHVRSIALLGALAVASLLLRRVAPAWLGRPALLFVPMLALLPLRAGSLAQAQLVLFAGYAWVSRDTELISVAAAAGLAGLLGRRLALLGAALSRARGLVVLSFWFSLSFVLRAGVTGGIDPTNLDLAAGAFGDHTVPAWWLGFCVIWKNLLALAIVGSALLGPLPLRDGRSLVRGMVIVSACRAPVLLAMMQFSGGSFWTSVRVVGELPYTMIFIVAGGITWGLVSALERNPQTALEDDLATTGVSPSQRGHAVSSR